MVNEKYLALAQNEAEMEKLTASILKEGCVALPDFLTDQTFTALLDHSISLGNKGRTTQRKDGTMAMDIGRSKEVVAVFDAIHKARCKILKESYVKLDPANQLVSLPKKDLSNPEETPFHFDDSYINAVLALRMPTNSREGNLLVYPNFRRYIKPLMLSRVLARMLRHVPFLRSVFKPREISYSERALHVFFGDLTLHGVPSITGGERLTLTINASR